MKNKSVPFVLCDVFAEKQFEGNQLAVITDAASLSADEMQKIAREFNFSESTFVLKSDGAATHQIRIFTPTHEVPFAGHPNVGTAYVLATALPASDLPMAFTFQEKAGLVDVTVSRTERGIFCEIKAPETLCLGAVVQTFDVAAALGLSSDDIDVSTHSPLIASVGLPFIVAGVASRSILSLAEIDMSGFKHLAEKYPCQDILIYWVDSSGVIHSRVFAPFDNVLEDPATGSANGALVALLSRQSSHQRAETEFKVRQGDDMGRPCRLYLRTVKRDHDKEDVFIGGYCRIVGSGSLLVESDPSPAESR